MAKLPIVSGFKVVKILLKNGFEMVSREGSHVYLRKKTKNNVFRTTVPQHKELGKGLLLDIIKQAGYTREEFLKLL